MATLPTPRILLTGLLASLEKMPHDAQDVKEGENPLKCVAGTYKGLFAALHVLLPQQILLPALDLLERGLVSRVVVIVCPSCLFVFSFTILKISGTGEIEMAKAVSEKTS